MFHGNHDDEDDNNQDDEARAANPIAADEIEGFIEFLETYGA